MTDQDLLAQGELSLHGRLVAASNGTFQGSVSLGGESATVVYKPVQGERPLWDFPDGTLAQREYAAYVVSEALGWSIVPPTLL
ncbi:MAG TPA: phosphatidylinositol kinase, partial [Kribbella sp.]|nr:phosphatidylinositol kinase [Kribbella sp.]